MLGAVSHAARGVGDTVVAIGAMAEEITSETGKVN